MQCRGRFALVFVGYLRLFEEQNVESYSELAEVFCPLVRASQQTDSLISELDIVLLQIAKTEPICNLLMTVPGVGPLTALRYSSYIDDPLRFATSREVGAYLGLVPRNRNSGTESKSGRITKFGSRM